MFAVLLFLALLPTACREIPSSPQEKAAVSQTGTGYIVPADSIEDPVVRKLTPDIIPAGKPKQLFLPPESVPVQSIAIIPVVPAICQTGQNGVLQPVEMPLTSVQIAAGLPDVVVANPPSAKDQNARNISIFGLQQGLKNLNVHIIKQDHYGNLWLGTGFGGVFRYDGKNFTHYTE